MRFVIELWGVGVFALDVTIPRLALFAPGMVPDSFEAIETWANQEDDE